MTEHETHSILTELRGFRDLMEERTDNISRRLDEVHAQAVKTNGRVSACELELAENRGKAKVQGILWGSISSVIVAVTAFFINKQLQ